MYNWKNVQYANSSGILSAMAENNKQAAAGRQQIVDSITGFGDAYSELQTGKATAALAGASTPEQAQDIFNQYQQGANGFVDQTALAESLRTQTKEFRDISQFDTDMAYKNSQLDVSKANLAIKQGELDFRNRAQGHLESMFNTSGDAAPSSNGTDYSSNKTFGTVMGTFNKGNYGKAQVNDTMGKAAGVDYNFGGLYSTKRSAGVIPLLTQAIQRSSELSGAERDAHRTGVLQDITNSNFQPEFNADLKKQFLEGIKTNRAEETLVTTRDQKNYVSDVNKKINTPETAPETAQAWGEMFTGLTLNGGTSKADAVTKYLPQLTKFMVKDINKKWQDRLYTDAAGNTVTNILQPGDNDGNFALEIIKNPDLQRGIVQHVQQLGLSASAEKTVLDSLNKNLGVTTLQKSRLAKHGEAVKKQNINTKLLEDNKEFNTLPNLKDMLGDSSTGAHSDVSGVYNLIQADQDLLAAGFMYDTDLFTEAVRELNPGVDTDSIIDVMGLSKTTSDFEIGTRARGSDLPFTGNYEDYALDDMSDDGLEGKIFDGTATAEEIMHGQWRTEEKNEAFSVLKIIILDKLLKRKRKKTQLQNEIDNYK
jgi:hypothetical protein